MNIDPNVLNAKIEFLLKNSTITPEPQASNFSKYLLNAKKHNNEEEDIINLCNSHGLHLRNEAILPLHKRYNTNDDSLTPVLKSEHLQPIKCYQDLLNKLKEMPKEWTIFQITKGFDPMDVIGVTKKHSSEDPTLYITKLPCGEVLNRVPPYYVKIPPLGNTVTGPNILQRLEELLKQRREFYNNPRDKKAYNSTDSELASCVLETESYWIREWKCLLSGRLEKPEHEEGLYRKVGELLKDLKHRHKKTMDIICHLAINAHHLKDREILKALKSAVDKDDCEKSDILTSLADAIKSINHSKSINCRKVDKMVAILIVDPSLELFPWEMTTTLAGSPVCRISSFQMLYAMFKYHEPYISNGYRALPMDSAFCLLNPDKDLMSCEKRLGEFFEKELPWINVKASQVPEESEIADLLGDHRLYLYCGHGSGTQYLTSGTLKKSFIAGIVLLYGCSSNLPKGLGGRTPFQNDTYTYLNNGCPCLIGALYDLSSSDADLACIGTLSAMLPIVSKASGKIQVDDPAEPDVLRAVVLGKNKCLKYCTKCAFVVRGLPVKIVCNVEERTKILENVT